MGSAMEKRKLLDFLKNEIKSTLKTVSKKEIESNDELLQKTKALRKLLSFSEAELEKGGTNELY